MCIGIPMRVCEMLENTAWCMQDGERVLVDMMLVGWQPVNSWVLTFRGSAVRTMSEEEAKQMKAALLALQQVMMGDVSQVDTLFADLVNRDLQLPEHLRKEMKS
ncbi:MAG: HypC/HybG/HupF family hydrogenase formation chaperone [Burkholderiales bacterium]|jgi:hydrogenase assembly chaperone HypC/HupF|nr:HypC/HybG/HupF family hydrogenase formation chaperone [Burkholderiales bacterium]